jgi:hypothetical protein
MGADICTGSRSSKADMLTRPVDFILISTGLYFISCGVFRTTGWLNHNQETYALLG